MNIEIIYKDNNYIIVEKPAGIPSQPDKTGDEDLLSELEKQFKNIWLLHRLDRPVGGLMAFALNEKTAIEINKQINNGSFKKNYYAVSCGVPKSQNGELRNYLVKNQRLNISSVSNKENKNAKEAALRYSLMETVESGKFGKLSLIDIELLTGRHHQIRVQMSYAGLPLWGDVKYNQAFKRGYFSISPALYSHRIELINPDTNEKKIFEKSPDFEPFNLFKFS